MSSDAFTASRLHVWREALNTACIHLFHFGLILVFHHRAIDSDPWPPAFGTLERFAMWWESQRTGLWNAQTSSLSGIDNHVRRLLKSPSNPLSPHSVADFELRQVVFTTSTCKQSEWLISCYCGYWVCAKIATNAFFVVVPELKKYLSSKRTRELEIWLMQWQCKSCTVCHTAKGQIHRGLVSDVGGRSKEYITISEWCFQKGACPLSFFQILVVTAFNFVPSSPVLPSPTRGGRS